MRRTMLLVGPRIRWGARRRHLANTIERFTRDDNAALRRITLTPLSKVIDRAVYTVFQKRP